jgi:DNA-binding MarR family transcriptional regulator
VSDDDKAKVLAKSTNENSTAKELAERTQLDIATVRVAITKLVDEGKLTKQKGQGQKPTKLAK